jgi:hypothetical protein
VSWALPVWAISSADAAAKMTASERELLFVDILVLMQ